MRFHDATGSEPEGQVRMYGQSLHRPVWHARATRERSKAEISLPCAAASA